MFTNKILLDLYKRCHEGHIIKIVRHNLIVGDQYISPHFSFYRYSSMCLWMPYKIIYTVDMIVDVLIFLVIFIQVSVLSIGTNKIVNKFMIFWFLFFFFLFISGIKYSKKKSLKIIILCPQVHKRYCQWTKV